MKYALTGHEMKTAVEEMILTLLPDCQPRRVLPQECAGEMTLRSALIPGEGFARLETEFCWQGQCRRDERQVDIKDCPEQEKRRRLTHQLKLSVYACVRPFLDQAPPWGSMTGVRPGKLARRLLESAQTPAQAQEALEQTYFVSPRRAELAVSAALWAQATAAELSPKQVAVYAGIPFCPSRCSYCSFVSHAIERTKKLIEPYCIALCKEIDFTAELLVETGQSVTSRYLGGGTPTTLDARQLDGVLGALNRLPTAPGFDEFTVEAGRPDTIDREKLSVMQGHGVSRISINPQSMNPQVLRQIGRGHSPQQVLDCFALARQMGFDNINMDVIAGLDGDTPESFFATLDTLIALGPENLTVHTLAAKKGADRARERADETRRRQSAQMVDGAYERLMAAGYRPYYLYRQKYMAGGLENIGWSRPGYECRYNIAMMEEIQDVISLGAGGVSKLLDKESGAVQRVANPKYPYEYNTGWSGICRNKERIRQCLMARRDTKEPVL